MDVLAHSLQELDDLLLLAGLYSVQLVQPEFQFSPGVLKHATVLQHLNKDFFSPPKYVLVIARKK